MKKIVYLLYCLVFPEIPQGIHLFEDSLHSLVGLMKNSIFMKVIMEHQQHNTDRENIDPAQWQFIHHQ
jgi:hypothetical protein